jgi:predicted short-subunit dehydrogenase-like oxidoreductase (DUF2520 family)
MNISSECVGIIGAGRVAQALGRLLRERGDVPVVIASRTKKSAETAAAWMGAAPVSLEEITKKTKRLLIAVSDDGLPEVASKLMESGLRGATVLHTCGSRGPEVLSELSKFGNSAGVLHPLQTVPSAVEGAATLPGSAFAVAGDTEAVAWAEALVALLGGTCLRIEAGRWPLYHAAAVMACNYQATLVDAALELLERAGLSRTAALSAIAPLVRATTANVLRLGPDLALTGPIQRGDSATVRAHMAALRTARQETAGLYSSAGLRTLEVARRRGLSEEKAEALAKSLRMFTC